MLRVKIPWFRNLYLAKLGKSICMGGCSKKNAGRTRPAFSALYKLGIL
jgi:hypothetical protein